MDGFVDKFCRAPIIHWIGGILEIVVDGIVGPDRRRDASGLQQLRENQALLFMPD